MRAELVTVPGGDKPNEDTGLASPDVIVVLDGLTSPPTLGSGCVHGTPWYVRRLAAHLATRAAIQEHKVLADVLAEAIDATANEHGSCDLGHPGTPSAAVALLRRTQAGLDYLALADCTVAIAHDGRFDAFTDNRVDDIEPEEHAAVLAAPIGSDERQAKLAAYVEVQRGYRNQPGGYWVAGAVPEAAEQAITGSIPLHGAASAALMSDGASRYVDLFAIGDWAAAFAVMAGGAARLIAEVREHEDRDPLCVRWPRYKRSDDATVAYWEAVC